MTAVYAGCKMLTRASLRKVSFVRAQIVRLRYFCFPLVFLGVAVAVGVAIAGRARNPDRLGAAWLVPAVMASVVVVGVVRHRVKERLPAGASPVVVTGHLAGSALPSKKYCRWLFEAEGDRVVLTSTSEIADRTTLALTDLVVVFSGVSRPEWIDVSSTGGRFYFPLLMRPTLTLAQLGFAQADDA